MGIGLAALGSLQCSGPDESTSRSSSASGIVLSGAAPDPSPVTPGTAASSLPVFYEANEGQLDDPAVRYLSRRSRFIALLGRAEATLLWSSGPDLDSPSTLRMSLRDGASDVPITPAGELPGKTHYLVGDDPAAWITGARHYAAVRYEEVLPGVDWLFRGTDPETIEFDLILAPRVDPRGVVLQFEGVHALSLRATGDLLLSTGDGEIVLRRPEAYQELAGQRHSVASAYVLEGPHEVGFAIGPYDRDRPLVIDPTVLVFSKFAGFDSTGLGTAIDATGATYLTGVAFSLPSGLAAPAHKRLGPAGTPDAFVAKLVPPGFNFSYLTFVGGSGRDTGVDVAVDAMGRAYIAGATYSADLPTVNALQPRSGSALVAGGEGGDAFIARLAPDGASLELATYLGGSRNDVATGVAVDSVGRLYLSGSSRSSNFPVKNPLPSSGLGAEDAFVARIESSGALSYSTLLGGTHDDQGSDIAIDPSGNAYVVGTTYSPDFRTGALHLAQGRTANGALGSDAFLAKLDPSGVTLVYTALLGSRGLSQNPTVGLGVAVDASEAVVLTGATQDCTFPTTAGALEPVCPASASVLAPLLDSTDAFVTKLDTKLGGDASLVFSSFLGGRGFDAGFGVAIDGSSRVYVTGATSSLARDFPLVNPTQAIFGGGPTDAFIAMLAPDASQLEFASFFGFTGGDAGMAVAVASSSSFSVAGGNQQIRSAGLPLRSLAEIETGGLVGLSSEAFVLRFGQVVETTITSGPAPFTNATTATFTFVSSIAASTFECSFDASASAPCVSPFTPTAVLAEGAHEFTVLAVAPDGTRDPTPAFATFTVDRTPPETTIVSGPVGPTRDSTPTFEFVSSDAGSTFACALDAAASAPCASPFTTALLAEGSHTLAVQARDPAGNLDPTPATRSFVVDTVPPDTTITGGPPDPTNQVSASFSFASTEVGSSFECSLDGAAFTVCVSPSTVGPLAEGVHDLAVRSVDPAGNRDPTPGSRTWRVDVTLPVLVLVSPTSGSAVAATPVTVTISASEPVVVTASSVFASGTALPAGNTTTSLVLKAGYNTFSTFVRDLAGNGALFTFSLFLDNTPPTLSFLSPGSGSAVSFSPVAVLVSISEDVTVLSPTAGFLPAGALGGGERTLTLSLSPGDNVFGATLRDRAGNQTVYSVATGNAFRLTLDRVVPPPPTITSPAEGTVTDARSITVSGTASGNAASVRISAGSTVTVPVVAGAFSGTVTLPGGPTRIRAVALSAAGAVSPEASVGIVVGSDIGFFRIVAPESGDLQSTATGTQATQPLVAAVFDLAGNPLPGVPVTFSLVAEPFSADGFLGAAGKTATVTTNAAGRASTTVTVATAECRNPPPAGCVLQPTVVTATVPAMAGGAALFRVQGINPVRLTPSGSPPSFVIPLGIDCRPIPGSPTGQCPLGEVNKPVRGFAVLLLDASFRVVPGWPVTFTASPGRFGAATSVTVASDANGVARSGDLTLAPTIVAAKFILLHPEDLFPTPVQEHGVTASTSVAGGGTATASFAAYAHAGRPAAILDVGEPPAKPDFVNLPADKALRVRVEDAFGNVVANVPVTFSGQTPPAPGPLLFRADPGASSASRCAFVIATSTDPCAVGTIAATTASDGTTWAQMILGNRASTIYTVRASVSPAFMDLTRTTGPVPITAPGDANAVFVLQASYTSAGTFAITETENDDTDPVTAVVWKTTCDDVAAPIGVCDGTFAVARDPNRTVSFASNQGATFSPASAVTGQQTSVDGGGRVPVTQPEVAAFLAGGALPASLTHSISTVVNPTLLLQAAGAQQNPSVRIENPPVTLACAENSKMTAGSVCDPTKAAEVCRIAVAPTAGVVTYVDLANDATENHVLRFTVEHDVGSPVKGRIVVKYNKTAHAKPTTGVDYFALVPTAKGRPGFYKIDDQSSQGRYGPTAAGATPLEFNVGQKGCYSFVVKSFMRTANRFETSPPADPVLEVRLLDGTLAGGPFVLNGWADLITRQRSDGRSGVPGGDGVIDWVQMRAWDFYKSPTSFLKPGPYPEEDTYQASGISVADGEPLEVFDQVVMVSSTFGGGTEGGQQRAAFTSHNGVLGATHSTGQVSPTVTFNTALPTLRTNELAQRIFWLDGSAQPAVLGFCVKRRFFHTAAHEARHAWQFQLWVQSNPSLAGYKDDEAPVPTPVGYVNLTPDNNDDLRLDDCFPERAQLKNGPDHGPPSGSGSDLIDDPATNADAFFKPMLHGERPADSALADRCAAGNPLYFLLERDAIRFGAAVLGDVIEGSEGRCLE